VGDQIHIYAKIVTVANMFDNLQYNLSAGGKRMLPHEACEHMMALAGTKLDRDVLIHFLRTVSVYPTGSSVRLSTKESGVVVGQHRGLPGRPIVRVVRQVEDQIQVKEVDLARHTTVFVESVLA
jgi:HD-GYP domain-containing protein (c-di-GMP phosphodiesterase class II)